MTHVKLATESIRSRLKGALPAGDRGSVAVEFALITVPLMIVVMGIIGFGIVFTQKQALSSAARDATRAGSLTYTGTSTNPSGLIYTSPPQPPERNQDRL